MGSVVCGLYHGEFTCYHIIPSTATTLHSRHCPYRDKGIILSETMNNNYVVLDLFDLGGLSCHGASGIIAPKNSGAFADHTRLLRCSED
jgi:hypothetical protein|tara:strand:- start:307 stop:573 length:267 start_codon:yes stop_codon:yes gene_type:complete